MASYSIIFVDRDRIRARRDIECRYLDEAVAEASRLLNMEPPYEAAEIWEGSRKLKRIEAGEKELRPAFLR